MLEKGAIQKVFPINNQLLTNLFLVRKKDGGHTSQACHKSEVVKLIHTLRTFQNGGVIHVKGNVATRALRVQTGHEGHIPLGTNRQKLFVSSEDRISRGNDRLVGAESVTT